MHLAAAALVCGAVCAVVGYAVTLSAPRVLARLPEPTPADDDGDYPPKVPYAVLAARTGLATRLALIAAAAAGGLGLLGWSTWLVLGVALSAVGTLLAYVDLRTWLLPTRLIAPAYALAVVVALAIPLTDGTAADLVRGVGAWLLAVVLYGGLWWLGAGMGYGDVRLGTLLGLALGLLGWGPWVVGLWAGFALGAVGWPVLRRLGVTTDRRLPFGPFLLAGAWVGAIAGEPVWAALVG